MSYSVYIGRDHAKNVAYVGITMQKPERRFSWHRSNGKLLAFEVVASGLSLEAAAKQELVLIEAYGPAMNKRGNPYGMKLPASLLSKEEKERRRSDPRWCSCCLRRRVNKGYSVCLRCEITRRRAQATTSGGGTPC